MCPPGLQVEREKAALLLTLQESQTQLLHTQGALSEQHERVHRLTERVNAVNTLRGDKESEDSQASEKPDGGTPSPPAGDAHDYDPDIRGFEVLECKYKVAVLEVMDLKAELKALKEKHNKALEGQGEAEPRGPADCRAKALDQQVGHTTAHTQPRPIKRLRLQRSSRNPL